MAGIVLATTLEPEPCADRMAETLGRETDLYWRLASDGETPGDRAWFFGRVAGPQFFVRRTVGRGNIFARVFCGRLVPVQGGGTEIHGRFRLHPAALIGMAIWFVILACLIASVIVLRQANIGAGDPRTAVLIGVAALLLSAGAAINGFLNGRRGEPETIDFVRRTLRCT